MDKSNYTMSAGKADTEYKNGSGDLRSATSWELSEARRRAEKALGFQIPDYVAEEVLSYTKRKLEVIRLNEDKPDSYLAILYENEITDHYMRICINETSKMMKGVRNHVPTRC